MGAKKICTFPGAGVPGGPCGAKGCPAMRDGACGLPGHIVLALKARDASPYLPPDTSDAADLENRTARVLLGCGMRPALTGYRYLQVAVRIGIQDPYKLAKVSARLFPAVAEECGTNASCVDRNIRNAVLEVFKEPNGYLLDLFPSVKDGSMKDVPNRWFVCSIADAIRRGSVA